MIPDQRPHWSAPWSGPRSLQSNEKSHVAFCHGGPGWLGHGAPVTCPSLPGGGGQDEAGSQPSELARLCPPLPASARLCPRALLRWTVLFLYINSCRKEALGTHLRRKRKLARLCLSPQPSKGNQAPWPQVRRRLSQRLSSERNQRGRA